MGSPSTTIGNTPPLLHDREVLAVAFSPDGKTVLTGCTDETARLWDVTTGKLLNQYSGHQGSVHAVAFSPDGKTILTGSADKTARLWDMATGEQQRPLWHKGEVLAVAFSPGGKTVLTGSADQEARLWEVTTGKLVGPPMRHSSEVWDVAFSPDGKRLATGANTNAHLWEAPVSVAGKVERITLWTQVITGMELKEDGEIHVLNGETWKKRWKRLMELGGPPLR